MKQALGYFLGFALFVVGIPALLWWVSGSPYAPVVSLHWLKKR